MTVEQVNQANEIIKKIEKLKVFKTAFSQSSSANFIVSKYSYYSVLGDFIEKESKLPLKDFQDLHDFISGYLSDKISELENQLEEL